MRVRPSGLPIRPAEEPSAEGDRRRDPYGAPYRRGNAGDLGEHGGVRASLRPVQDVALDVQQRVERASESEGEQEGAIDAIAELLRHGEHGEPEEDPERE